MYLMCFIFIPSLVSIRWSLRFGVYGNFQFCFEFFFKIQIRNNRSDMIFWNSVHILIISAYYQKSTFTSLKYTMHLNLALFQQATPREPYITRELFPYGWKLYIPSLIINHFKFYSSASFCGDWIRIRLVPNH